MKRVSAFFALSLLISILSVLTFATFFIVPSILFLYRPFSLETETVYTIPPGTDASRIVAGIAQMLNLPELDRKRIYWFVKIGGYGRGLKSGEYAIYPFTTPKSLIERIFRGEVIRYVVTVPEGSTIHDVGKRIEDAGLGKSEEVVRLASDPSFAHLLGIPAQTIEGYLFPETYTFTRLDNPETILKTMVRTFWKRFPSEGDKRAKDLGMTIQEIITMASIIEKEAVLDEERPIIAGVFYNRLKKNMPLQSDPTAVYDIPFFKGPVKKEHLLRKTPYNTYVIRGLPPSPICNPGLASIKAALYPAEVPYLYFVSRGDGRHIFSRNYEEHLNAIRTVRAQDMAESGIDPQSTDRNETEE